MSKEKIYCECPNCGNDISVELGEHDKQIRADERAKTVGEIVNIQNKSYAVIVEQTSDEYFRGLSAMPLQEYKSKVIDEFVNEIKRIYFDDAKVIRCCELVANGIKEK